MVTRQITNRSTHAQGTYKSLEVYDLMQETKGARNSVSVWLCVKHFFEFILLENDLYE
jgi:hypothetical protein